MRLTLVKSDNLQYAFAHCVFGYPNGTGIGSYPCMTSEACGPLKSTVTSTLANKTGTDPFGYCRYKGGSTFGDTFGKCLDCMGPDTEHGYVTNCASLLATLFPLILP